MALPAVLRMFRNARLQSFEIEVKEIYKSAQNTYLSKSISSLPKDIAIYSNEEYCSDTLEITGNSNLKYLVIVDPEGNVTRLKATNGTFFYDSGSQTDLKIETLVLLVMKILLIFQLVMKQLMKHQLVHHILNILIIHQL